MPTYEYKCECGHRFEQWQRMTDKPVMVCPKCYGAPKRMLGPGSGIIFKGPGFYETDYKRKGKDEKTKTDSGKGADNPPVQG